MIKYNKDNVKLLKLFVTIKNNKLNHKIWVMYQNSKKF